jgi:glycosyltransferase involved in cell wall biosynthesis
MNVLISICIPTYRRPELLLEAVNSCLQQTYPNLQIVICDDSLDDVSERLIAGLECHEKIKYFRNLPSLGQARNVNKLFEYAEGEYLVLLHDDDLLLPDAVKSMLQCLQENPDIDACFGKQQIVDPQSRVLVAETEALNKDYYRIEDYAGVQSSPMKSALLGQFPNNGYLVKTEIAKSVGYRDLPEVGDACDYDFALRLAAHVNKFYFLNQFTASYRVFNESIMDGNNNYTNLTYNLVLSLVLPESLEQYRHERLQKYAAPAINKWLQLNEKKNAMDIYRSRIYPWRKKMSLIGILQILLVLLPHEVTLWVVSKKRAFR